MLDPFNLPTGVTPGNVANSDSTHVAGEPRSWAPVDDVNVEQQWWQNGVTAAASILAAAAGAAATIVVSKRQSDDRTAKTKAQADATLAAMPAAMKTAEAAMQQAMSAGFGVLIDGLRSEVTDLRARVHELEVGAEGDARHIRGLENALRQNGLGDSIPAR